MDDAGDGISLLFPYMLIFLIFGPATSQRHQKIRQIVNREFDVEILHKWREIRILEDELDKGLQLQALLEKLLLNGNALSPSISLANIIYRACLCWIHG